MPVSESVFEYLPVPEHARSVVKSRDSFMFHNAPSTLLLITLHTYRLYSDGQPCDLDEKYVTLADRNPNIHKQGSLRKDYVAYRDHWLRFIFPGCLSHYPHPFANEISTALSSCGYIGLSQITSNKQLTDEMEFHIYENMNLKLSLP